MAIDKKLFFSIPLLAIANITSVVDVAVAEEKKSYSRPPFSTFASQMSDGLLGSDKYEKPQWNLHNALNLPKWLDIAVEQRTRYESMAGNFRAGSKGGDQQIPLQTDVWLQAHINALRFGVEFLDARAIGADTGSGVNNNQANQADFLQGYAAWADQNLLYSGIGSEVIVGRQTLNFGSRRLLARNAFRNTINSFTGVRLRLLDYDKWQFNGFATMPVLRYPTAAKDILNDVQQFDEEDIHTWFSGGFLEIYDLAWGVSSEVYLYHLDEGDSARNLTRNRRYFTPGVRLFTKPGKAKFDFQVESIGQFGTVRATTAAKDGINLEHEAWSQHVDFGYTLDMPWSPRLGLEYDYASGDKNPNDNQDQRFDPLYGARRFDFGPTGIYGGFARSNINTPGYRLNLAPRSDLQITFSHRAFWLASAKDAWTTSTGQTEAGASIAALQDKTGHSGNYVGQQLDLSCRWDFNSSLNFETGWTHLFKGQFAKTVTNAPNIDYFYVQSQLRF